MKGDSFSLTSPRDFSKSFSKFCVNESSPKKTEFYDNRNSKILRETENPLNKGVFRTVLNCSTYTIKANVGWLVMLTLIFIARKKADNIY